MPGRRSRSIPLVLLLIFFFSLDLAGCSVPTAIPTPRRATGQLVSLETGASAGETVAATASPTDSPVPTATSTDTPSPTGTATSPSSSPTHTPTHTPSATQVATLGAVGEPRSNTPGPFPGVPVLMYHHIGPLPPGADALRIDLTVPTEVFETEVSYLAAAGYNSVHLADVVNHFATGAPLLPNPIVLTFDDGYEDNYTFALPVLKAHSMSGSFFIITGRADAGSPGYLSWSQIKELADNGMEIGSHSLDHRFDLGKMTRNVQLAEIKPAQDALALHLPNMPLVFAYPSGSYNSTTLSILQEAGYAAAVTTRQGLARQSDSPLELRRIRIRGPWGLPEFRYWLDYWSKGK